MSPKDQAAQAEQRSPLRLPNRISDANVSVTEQLRRNIKDEVQQERRGDRLPYFFLQMSHFTFLLSPYWESFPTELKMFLEKEMFDPIMRHVLESAGLLNWCTTTKKLYPLITSGDGNCLPHAVSLALWGLEDTELVLRGGLYSLLCHDTNVVNQRRWQRERMRFDAIIPDSGFMYNSTEWHVEWDLTKIIADPDRRPQDGLPYESLEQFHIFMLANILRRPIIVVAQDTMRNLCGHSLQPQNLSGIYLPLNWDSSVCCRYPILLAFDQNHFTPLVCTAQSDGDESEYLFPLVHRDLTPMPVRFLLEEEEVQVDSLLEQFLIVEENLEVGPGSNEHWMKQARLVSTHGYPEYDLMTSYMQLAETHYRSYLEVEFGDPSPQSASVPEALVGQSRLNDMETAPPMVGPVGRQVEPSPLNYVSGSGLPLHQPSDSDPMLKTTAFSSKQPKLSRNYSMINQNCKTKGCNYYQSVTTGEYCHECFQKEEANQQCKGDRCLNPPEQSCQGFCQVCFDQSQMLEAVVVEPTAPFPSIDPLSNASPSSDPHVAYYYNQLSGNMMETRRPGMTYVKAAGSKQIPPLNDRKESNGREQVHQEQDEINSLFVDQKLATKKCIIPECPLTGHPETHDMCRACYDIQVDQRLKKSTRTPLATKKCIIPECPFPGHLETHDMCRACYDIQVDQRVNKSTRIPLRPASSAVSATTAAGQNITAGQSQATATASASQPFPAHPKPAPRRYTVQKNLCANAGCDGIRLTNLTYQGYCIRCYGNAQGQKTVKSSASSSAAPPHRPRKQLDQHTSKVAAVPSSIRLAAQPPTINQSQPVNSVAPAPKHQQEESHVEQAFPISTVPGKSIRCGHPRCDGIAAPPKYVLCDQCIAVYNTFSKEMPNRESNSLEENGFTQNYEEAVTNQPKESGKPLSQQTPEEMNKDEIFLQQKLLAGFQNVYKHRLKCQAEGGCDDDMYGDPALGNLCSRCFSKTSHRLVQPTIVSRVGDTRPYHPATFTAPLRPSPRMVSIPPPTAQTEVFPARRSPPGARPKRTPLPSNFKKCSRAGCRNQANLKVLDGYCNDCYQVYMTDVQTPGAGTKPTAAEPNRTNMRCFSVGCQSYGNPRCHGYCNACYKLIVK